MSRSYEAFKVLRNATIAIMFFGTPHRGSDLAGYGNTFARISAAFRGEKPTSAAKELNTSSQILKDTNSDFKDAATNYDMISVCETQNVPYIGLVEPFHCLSPWFRANRFRSFL